MVTNEITRHARLLTPAVQAADSNIEPVQAAETILRRFGARAISVLSSARTLDDGRVLPARLSPNDCYVAMDEACRKMARVALRKFSGDVTLQAIGFADSLDVVFPDPTAYLCRCIRSVVSDAERLERRELPTVSMDQPFSSGIGGDSALCLRDTIADTGTTAQPEIALIEQDERQTFRRALSTALKSIPENYLAALQRDVDRDRERNSGARVAPETDRERQTVCRARAALSQILKRECGPDNPFIRLLAQQRSGRVRQKSTQSANWSAERQQELFRRLLNSPWAERSTDAHPEANLEEAVVNEVSRTTPVAPPTPEMRQAMRVMDTYTLGDNPQASDGEAQAFYAQARTARKAGKIEEAIRLYKAAYDRDPDFLAAFSEVGVLLSQMGNLRDALKVYVTIIEHPRSGDNKYIAATNAADIYLTWFDAGRNRERNIERATYYAQMAMEKPTPMRACNLLMAYVKDRYFLEAQQLMDMVLQANLPQCGGEKFLQTLFQIRDADLVAWWTWLDGELRKED